MQSCYVLNDTGVISSKFINKFVQKCQCYYTLTDQSIPLVAVTSVISLQTEQLWIYARVLGECPLLVSHVFWPFLTYLPTLSYSKTSFFLEGGLFWTPLPTLRRFSNEKVFDPTVHQTPSQHISTKSWCTVQEF